MSRRYYSRRHYQRISNGGPDTSVQIEERQRWYRSIDLGRADAEARYPEITPENAREVIAYQDERIRYHYAATQRHGIATEDR